MIVLKEKFIEDHKRVAEQIKLFDLSIKDFGWEEFLAVIGFLIIQPTTRRYI